MDLECKQANDLLHYGVCNHFMHVYVQPTRDYRAIIILYGGKNLTNVKPHMYIVII